MKQQVYKKLYVKCPYCQGTQNVQIGNMLGKCYECEKGYVPIFIELEEATNEAHKESE